MIRPGRLSKWRPHSILPKDRPHSHFEAANAATGPTQGHHGKPTRISRPRTHLRHLEMKPRQGKRARGLKHGEIVCWLMLAGTSLPCGTGETLQGVLQLEQLGSIVNCSEVLRLNLWQAYLVEGAYCCMSAMRDGMQWTWAIISAPCSCDIKESWL